MKEVWKDVVGYEGFYEVSDMGNVRRKGKGKVLKSRIHRDGYRILVLCVDCKGRSFQVHRLVATAFIANRKNKEQVNHKNGVKHDNRVCNLEWVTRSENQRHAIRTGLQTHEKTRGENNYLCKISEVGARDIKLNYKRGVTTYKYFADKYNVSIHIVGKILQGKNWRWII